MGGGGGGSFKKSCCEMEQRDRKEKIIAFSNKEQNDVERELLTFHITEVKFQKIVIIKVMTQRREKTISGERPDW